MSLPGGNTAWHRHGECVERVIDTRLMAAQKQSRSMLVGRCLDLLPLAQSAASTPFAPFRNKRKESIALTLNSDHCQTMRPDMTEPFAPIIVAKRFAGG